MRIRFSFSLFVFLIFLERSWATECNLALGSTKLVGSGSTGAGSQGWSVSVSADGNTLAVGGYADNSGIGATWIFIRNFTSGTWNQQGSKLVGTGYVGLSWQGFSVSVSADGNTLAVGGSDDDGYIGAAWVFTRSGGTWTQQGSKLVGTGYAGLPQQGYSVSISADGNTLAVGGFYDNYGYGATWIFIRNSGTWSQQGSKLIGTGYAGSPLQGSSVSLSSNGNILAVGGLADNNLVGAAWIFIRNLTTGTWNQQGSKLVGTGYVDSPQQGWSVSLSADGNNLAVGGYADSIGIGAAWIFIRNITTGTWNQQGSKLVGTGYVGADIYQGISVSFSNYGNVLAVGGYNDNSGIGATWVSNFTSCPYDPSSGNARWAEVGGLGQTIYGMCNDGYSGAPTRTCSTCGVWSPVSNPCVCTGDINFGATKLVGTGYAGLPQQGYSVSVSANGNILAIGGPYDDSNIGTTWIFTRNISNGIWNQQGSKLVGTGSAGSSLQGWSVSVSSDGNTLAIGGTYDDNAIGATWIFIRNLTSGTWNQQGSKLVGTGYVGLSQQGYSVSVSADGNTLAVGGYADNSGIGATWVFIRNSGTWSQQGSKLVGTGYVGSSQQGYSVSVSADGNTLAVGGQNDNSGIGATWIFIRNSGTWSQQGTKLVGTGYVGTYINQGSSVSVSANGNILAIGGPNDNSYIGATWIFIRNLTSGTWNQQGSKLVGTGYIGLSQQGYSVSLSGNGNILAFGGASDRTNIGATWIFIRNLTSGTWNQQGSKLVGTGYVYAPNQGYSVSVSSDGNTLAVGGQNDNTGIGATWVSNFTSCPYDPSSGNARWAEVGGLGQTIYGMCNDGYSGAPTRTCSTCGVWSPVSNPCVCDGDLTFNGTKLIGTGYVGKPNQGFSVSVSSDGNTMAVGGLTDNSNIGAAWIFTRNLTSGTWTQQGSKLVGTGYTGQPWQGYSVSVSADGNTLAVGGYADNSLIGATWIFIRNLTSGTWSQQGSKLVGTGYAAGVAPQQGFSVSLSADGSTLAVGGAYDNTYVGATWIFTRNGGGTWTQQGSKLVGTGYVGGPNQGFSVSLSADGNTLAVGGLADNSLIGAAWIFTRNLTSGTWTQQGSKLVGTGYTGSSPKQGISVSLSADGNTLAVGGAYDNSNLGATWIFTRNGGGTWTQQGSKLVGTGYTGSAIYQGWSVSVSADGNALAVGAQGDNSLVGAAWIFTRNVTSGAWTQQGSKLVGTGYVGSSGQGYSVSLSNYGKTLAVGGYNDNSGIGATWVSNFISCPSDPSSGNARWAEVGGLGQTIYGTCNDGYSGAPTRTCSTCGVWSPVSNPCV